jgi:TRAP-type C4-dicarboxylate transport system substrate-binding protein
MRPHLVIASLVALGLLAGGCGSSASKATGARSEEPITLTLANTNAGEADVGAWMNAVKRLSAGSIRIELRSSWRADEAQAERGTLADVRAGKVDIAKITARAWDTLGVTSFQALHAPFLVDSLELERRVLSGPLGAEMLDGVRAAGVEPVAAIPGPLRFPLGISRDLDSAAAYRNALIGSRPSAVATETFAALGGRSVDVAAGADIAELDGFDTALADIEGFGYDEVARSVTVDAALWPRAVTLVMNRDAWKRLSPAQREILTGAARAAAEPVVAQLRSVDRAAAQGLCDRDFALVRAGADGIDELRRAVEPVHRRLESDAGTRDALERIRELKAEAPVAPVARCGSDAAAAPEPASGPLVGTWHTRATRELMAAADREDEEAVEDNYGDITLILSPDGRFEILNARFPDEPAGFGTWSGRGDVLEMKAGGTAEQGAGQTFRYRWNLFRDSLVLRKLNEAPTALTAAPLRRD